MRLTTQGDNRGLSVPLCFLHPSCVRPRILAVSMSSHWRISNIYWRAPASILLTFLVGLAFALGHHYFYRSLDGMGVSTAAFDQEYNIGIGTAFAFLVRACLVIAVGDTYWQVF